MTTLGPDSREWRSELGDVELTPEANETQPETEEAPRILCVDEAQALGELENVLFGAFDVTAAATGEKGLEALDSEGPFEAVVADLRLRDMCGPEFLAKARELAPETVRVALTGQADLSAVIAAINAGNVYRCMSKPCPPETLIESLQAAVEEHRRITAERQLLEDTLTGTVTVLADVLRLAAPEAFNRSDRIRAFVAHMAEHLGLEDHWQYEAAATLSHIGCVTLPPDTLERAYAGQPISEQEQQMLDDHPEVGRELLARIPPLSRVAAFVGGQSDPNAVADPEQRLGAEMLRVALAADRLIAPGMRVRTAVGRLEALGEYDERVLEALRSYGGAKRGERVCAVEVRQLRSFMILDQDVQARNGVAVMSKGQELNTLLVDRLRNWHRGPGLVEPIRVRVPAGEAAIRVAKRRVSLPG